MPVQGVYKVSVVSGQPVFDSLPVAKITEYPLEKRDYKPFAQSILCAGADMLYLRMWAFEVTPMPTSALACVLYLFPGQPELALSLRIEHGQREVSALAGTIHGGVFRHDEEASRLLERHPHNGEDLQGVYWGMTLHLPMEAIRKLGGEPPLKAGDSFRGNFYKTCEDKRFAHSGGFYPAVFPDDPYGTGSMGDFRVVAY